MSSPSERRTQELLIWGLAAVALAGAGALIAVRVGDLHALSHPHLPWWALALGFAAAERLVIHVHFRRSAHSFTVSDVPMVLGLLFASGPQLLIGAAVGSTAMWVIDRRLPPIKLFFNLAQLTLAACVAEIVVHAYTGNAHVTHPVLWLVTFGAVEAGALVTVALISAAIALSEGALPEGMLEQMFGLDLMFTVTNTTLGLIAAIVIKAQTAAAPLMLLPVAGAYLAYRAYLTERQRHERLEFLYDAARTLSQTPDVTEALEALLTRARDVFRAERAELVLFSGEGLGPLRISQSGSGEADRLVAVDGEVGEGLRGLVAGGTAVDIRPEAADSTPLSEYLVAREVSHAILAPLAGDGRIAGTLMLANRVGVVRGFDAEDRKLLEALATNASVALQFDRLEQTVWQLRDLRRQLEHQSAHDPLTGLPNRGRFAAEVSSALERESGSAAVVLIDVDDFNDINDTRGPSIGDELLTALAQRLQGHILPSDIVARTGGDEFAIVLTDVPDPAQAGTGVAERILRGLATPLPTSAGRIPVQVSIGIAIGRPGYEDTEELIGNADVAMHFAKHAGKGRSALFEPRMRSTTIERASLRSDLERALERGQISVDYQPIVSLADGEVVGAEALVRWRRQYGKLLTAAEFIPLAQETGLILPLGEFVLADACRQACEWLSSGQFERDIAVHVNLSAIELEDPKLVARVAGLLEQSRLPPHLLVLEVTEAAVLHDRARAATHLGELRNRGVRLALDDFGTGYSSLDYLHSVPFTFLKVARTFVHSVTGGSREMAFVRTVRELGENLGLQVVAAGIETEEQLDLLGSLGCQLGQGFLIGRPAAPSALLRRGYPLEHEPGAWLRSLEQEKDRPPA